MKRLSGFVLVKETGSGVANLVVAAYDADKSASTMGADNEIRDLRINGLGKRIGSVLTDQDGRFVLTGDDLEFQGNESRPDLLLVVFAPEDVLSVEQPYPLPAEKRVLYISAASIADAGALEAVLIRLRQEQLDRFQIPTGQTAGTGSSQSSRFASVVESTWAFRDGLKNRLAPRLREEQLKAAARRKAAQEQVKDLSAIPLDKRNHQFLIRDRDDLKANLEQKQADAVADGLDRMAKLRPVLRLPLSSADLADLGLTKDGEKVTGQLDANELAAKVRTLTNGLDLIMARGFGNPSPDDLERKYLIPAQSDSTAEPIG